MDAVARAGDSPGLPFADFALFLQSWQQLHEQTPLKIQSDIWLVTCVSWSVWLADNSLVFVPETFWAGRGLRFWHFPLSDSVN